MTIPAENEQKTIDAIIERELEMFLAVQSLGGTASCQLRPSNFKAMRWMTHSVLPYEYLISYLEDLETAHNNDINLMTIKYGRMDNLIPVYNDNPLIEKITGVEMLWMQELRQSAPGSLRDTDGESFKVYLSCELETLSANTLQIYFDAVKNAQSQGRNFAKERYENLRARFDIADAPAAAE